MGVLLLSSGSVWIGREGGTTEHSACLLDNHFARGELRGNSMRGSCEDEPEGLSTLDACSSRNPT